MKADFISRTTRIIQFILGLYLLFLAIATAIENMGAGTAITQIVDWEVRNRLLMGALFVFPHMNLKWILQPVYLLLLLGGTIYFFGPMAIAFDKPSIFPIGIILILVVLINVYFTLGIWARNMNSQINRNTAMRNKNVKGNSKKKKK